ncbi:cytochrome b561 and DOMON domain-containing protein At3g07570-like [Typha angustifolia]|uniref:cytochrome b561 and DOMON domain-containing protein At3g07570-like n=1 Tax=Typha angustifolia TaxID=59011 RepID=UPI003C2CC0B2
MEMERKNCVCSSSSSITILFLFLFSFSLVSSQSDSCSSNLAVSQLIPFNTSSFNCFPAWTSEHFIMRYARTATNTWSFVLSAPDTGTYISVGFSSDGRMVGSSAVAGWVTGSGVGIAKQYSLGGMSSDSCPPDQGSLQLVPNTTLIVKSSSRLYLAFQLTAAQPQPYLIYAVGPQNNLPSSDNRLMTHSNEASSSINYVTGVVSDAGSTFGTKRWHGFLAAFGWGILMPVGIVMARYFKHRDPFWFYSHISIQGIGFVFGVAGAIAGFSLGDDGPGNIGAHIALGITILVCGCLQVLAFLIRPDKSSKIRGYWNWYHHNIGRAAIIFAVANVFLGLSLAHESSSWSVFYGIFLAVWVLCSVVLEVKLWRRD